MTSVLIAAIVFACAFAGAVAGIFLQRALPPEHLSKDSRDAIKMGTGLVATMAALILGLLVGAAKDSFDSHVSGFRQLATNLIVLDRMLDHYGPEAQPIRQTLRRAVESMIANLWPDEGARSSGWADASITSNAAAVYDAIHSLEPHSDFQRAVQSQAVQIGAELSRTRWQLSELDNSSLPTPFLIVLTFWLFFLFVVFGLFAPKNATVITVLLVSAVSVAGAFFLIVDLDLPFEGFLRVSSAPLQHALLQIGQ